MRIKNFVFPEASTKISKKKQIRACQVGFEA